MQEAVEARAPAADPRCPVCRRDLWSVPLARYCPDCGAAVRPATPNDFHRSTSLGLLLVECSVVLSVALTAIFAVRSIIDAFPGPEAFVRLASLGAYIDYTTPLGISRTGATALFLLGWWLAASPPRIEEVDAHERVITRVTVLMLALVALAVAIEYALNPDGADPPRLFTAMVSGMNITAYLGLFFSSMLYLRRVAKSMGRPRLHRAAITLLWSVPLLMTAGVLVIVGPLIAATLYVLFLESMRAALRARP